MINTDTTRQAFGNASRSYRRANGSISGGGEGHQRSDERDSG
jgi:hypothetical protein